MDREENIKRMEEIFDEANSALRTLNDALSDYLKVKEKIRVLEKYYTSSQWMSDFEKDSEGLFPDNLKRGVLSQDGIYNMLLEMDETENRLRNI